MKLNVKRFDIFTLTTSVNGVEDVSSTTGKPHTERFTSGDEFMLTGITKGDRWAQCYVDEDVLYWIPLVDKDGEETGTLHRGNTRIPIVEKEHPVITDADDPPVKGGWYHLSINYLGEKFTFSPRLPNSPYVGEGGHVIEDDFTKRTSWASSIKDALNALGAGPSDMYRELHFVYHTSTLPGDVDLEDEFEHAPESPGNKYGTDFNLEKWVDWATKHTPDKKELQKKIAPPNPSVKAPAALKKLVPDAPETHEHWATKPVTATLIGKI